MEPSFDEPDTSNDKLNLEPEKIDLDESIVEEEYDKKEDGPTKPDSEVVSWEGKEYISGKKGKPWFIVFGLVVAVLCALAIYIKAWTFLALIIVSAVALVIYIKRPARMIFYSLGRDGLHIDNKLITFDEFKSFGVLKDGENFSIVLIPKKRFSPSETVYFPENYGEAIVDMFGARLPMQDVKLDMIDRIIRKLRI